MFLPVNDAAINTDVQDLRGVVLTFSQTVEINHTVVLSSVFEDYVFVFKTQQCTLTARSMASLPQPYFLSF